MTQLTLRDVLEFLKQTFIGWVSSQSNSHRLTQKSINAKISRGPDGKSTNTGDHSEHYLRNREAFYRRHKRGPIKK